MLVAWKQSLQPFWDPSAKPAPDSKPKKEFTPAPPTLEAATTGRASCKLCGETIEKGEQRVGLPAFIRGAKATAWLKTACAQRLLSVGEAENARSKCKASGEKIEKGDLRLCARIASNADLAEGTEKSKTFYKPSAIVDFLASWMEETGIEPNEILGFAALPDAQEPYKEVPLEMSPEALMGSFGLTAPYQVDHAAPSGVAGLAAHLGGGLFASLFQCCNQATITSEIVQGLWR